MLFVVLNEGELREYEMRISHVADLVRGDLRFMETTPEEFQQLVQVRQKAEESPERDYYAQNRRVVEEVTRTLGEERGREYARSSDLFYQWSREAAARFGVDESAAQRAWQLKTETMRQAESIRANKAAPAEERRQGLLKLRRSTEEQLRQMLGPEAFAFASRGDGVWLTLLAERLDR